MYPARSISFVNFAFNDDVVFAVDEFTSLANHASSEPVPIKYVPSSSICGSVNVFPSHAFSSAFFNTIVIVVFPSVTSVFEPKVNVPYFATYPFALTL